MVLLRKSAVVLRGEEADLPRSTAARSQLAQEGFRVVRSQGRSGVQISARRDPRGHRRSPQTDALFLRTQRKVHVRQFDQLFLL